MKLAAINAEAAEDAIKYIIFLADANKLFDVALGMYDFELVLAVAQNSQKVSLSASRLKRLVADMLHDDRTHESISPSYENCGVMKSITSASRSTTI